MEPLRRREEGHVPGGRVALCDRAQAFEIADQERNVGLGNTPLQFAGIRDDAKSDKAPGTGVKHYADVLKRAQVDLGHDPQIGEGVCRSTVRHRRYDRGVATWSRTSL